MTSPDPSPPSPWQTISRTVLAVGFVGVGVMHFVVPPHFEQIVPPGFGPPSVLVAISGVAEIAGGLGLLIPPLRRAAGWGLIALLIAVFPANVYMALFPERFPFIAAWLLYARLPMQGVLIAGVWYAALRSPTIHRSVDISPT